jgi:DNA-binding winged helix-turn-helix (wHTH) protein
LNADFSHRDLGGPLEPWRLDVAQRALVSGKASVRLEPISLKFLLVLIQNEGRVTSRQEIVDRVWGGRIVTDDAFSRQVAKLRSALADNAAIETLPKTGLRLAVPVTLIEPVAQRAGRAVRDHGLIVAAGLAAIVIVAALLYSRQPERPEAVELRPLTSEPGMEIEPALSPDGRWIVYAALRPGEARYTLQLRSLGADSGRRIGPPRTGTRHPAWSPHGDRIAFFGRGEADCRIMVGSPFTARFRAIAQCHSILGGLAWASESQIVVADRTGPGLPLGLTLLDVASGRSRPITRSRPGGPSDSLPLRSPDGGSLYFVRTLKSGDDRLVRIDLADLTVTEISREPANIDGLAHGPRGRLLVAARRGAAPGRLWEVEPRSGNWVEVAPVAGVELSAAADGRTAAFREDRMRGAIWALDARSSNPERVTDSSRFDWLPSLSPDRRRLAFISNRSGHTALWIRDMASGVERRAAGAQALTPETLAWSPDSSSIAIAGRDGHGPGFFILQPDGTRMTRLPTEAGVHPSFSTDGHWLYFSRLIGRTFVVIARDLATGAERRVIADAIRPIAAEGGFLLYASPTSPGLWRLDLRSGATMRLSDQLRLDDLLNWTVVRDGVWLPDRDAGAIVRINVRTGARTARRPLPAMTRASGLTGDESRLLVSLIAEAGADLTLLLREGATAGRR